MAPEKDIIVTSMLPFDHLPSRADAQNNGGAFYRSCLGLAAVSEQIEINCGKNSETDNRKDVGNK